MIRHVVWDWNGTILDDIDLTVAVCNEEVLRAGLQPLTKERYRRIFQHPVRNIYLSAGFQLDDLAFTAIANRFEKSYDDKWHTCAPFPDIFEVLHAVNGLGLTQSVLSALPHHILCRCVQHFELEHFFSSILGLPDNHSISKVYNAEQWINQSKLSADEIVIVGDTDHDAEVAAELGARCLLINRGYQESERLKATGWPVFSSAAPLVQFIKDHNLTQLHQS